MEKRRMLQFATEPEVIAEAELLLRGYRRLGGWSLGQNCVHIAQFIDCSIDGFPMKGPWLMRKVIGPIVRPMMLKRGKMPAGFPAPKEFQPPADADDGEGVRKLRASLDRFAAYNGAMQPSPALGKMTKFQWQRLHLIHAGHHLGFLVRA